jgi:hypothetical protein
MKIMINMKECGREIKNTEKDNSYLPLEIFIQDNFKII